MNRRDFVKTSSSVFALWPFVSLWSCDFKRRTHQSPIFVNIQLTGGNDSLNTLMPTALSDRLFHARKSVWIPEKDRLPLKITDEYTLHPSLNGIRQMIDDQQACFVQSVGYQGQSYSHFRSQDIWLAGIQAHQPVYHGWLSARLENKFLNYPEGYPNKHQPDPPAIKIGRSSTLAFQGAKTDYGIVLDPQRPELAPYIFQPPNPEVPREAHRLLTEIQMSMVQSGYYTERMAAVFKQTHSQTNFYPPKGENPLADQLNIVAQCIEAGLQTQVYHVELGGFDTHADQVDSHHTSKGEHSRLLKQLDQAISSFWNHIHRIGKQNQVMGMAFSEFGRRIVSNASRGTDHGAAQAVFLFGKQFQKPIIGNLPQIPIQPSVMDNIPHQFDFRSLYVSIIQQHLKANTEELALMFPDIQPFSLHFHS